MDNQDLHLLTQKVIIEFSKTIELFGLTTLEARLFAYLYVTDKVMTLDDMSEALGKSKTSMSTSIRSLAEQNLVSRVWRKGIRKDLYKANTPLFKLFIHAYINQLLDETKYHKEELVEIKNQLEKKQSDHFHNNNKQHFMIKLENIIDFQKQIESFFHHDRN